MNQKNVRYVCTCACACTMCRGMCYTYMPLCVCRQENVLSWDIQLLLKCKNTLTLHTHTPTHTQTHAHTPTRSTPLCLWQELSGAVAKLCCSFERGSLSHEHTHIHTQWHTHPKTHKTHIGYRYLLQPPTPIPLQKINVRPLALLKCLWHNGEPQLFTCSPL